MKYLKGDIKNQQEKHIDKKKKKNFDDSTIINYIINYKQKSNTSCVHYLAENVKK